MNERPTNAELAEDEAEWQERQEARFAEARKNIQVRDDEVF